MKYTIIDALHELNISNEWSIIGLDYSNLIWLDENTECPTEEEIQAKIQELEAAEPMRLLREERNKRLQETDWTQNRDVTLSNDSDWQTYRQSLRDLPSTASPTLVNGQLSNVTWPTKPEIAE